MAIFKCKMCGGTLEINNNETVATCEYCGTQQTLPRLDDDRKANLYDRANHFRRNNEFDKAMGIYEQILNEGNTDAEAYWSLVLCRYGIEYVEDPATHKRIPTVNRAQFTSIFDDDNYKSALRYADTAQQAIYQAEAANINEIQKGILAISQKEEPFDVFICYKETDSVGRRTSDSVLANDLYHQLTQEGFKVFFARITLEDKLGSAYEPYIFAALNSAKVMVVLGTKPEYFSAVWVKNEWSRYLALIKQGQQKMLVPAYKDMDPYDLPEEFSHLQAQDMGKLGFMQDLIRGIKKILGAAAPAVAAQADTSNSVAPLIKRAFMFLEDGDWQGAMKYGNKVLDVQPENAEGYVCKLLAELHIPAIEKLKTCATPLEDNIYYQRALRYADRTLEKILRAGAEAAIYNQKDVIYNTAVEQLKSNDPEVLDKAKVMLESIINHRDAGKRLDECKRKIDLIYYDFGEKQRKKRILIGIAIAVPTLIVAMILLITVGIPAFKYAHAESLYEKTQFTKAYFAFENLGGYSDSSQMCEACVRGAVKEVLNDGIYEHEELLASDSIQKYGEVICQIVEDSLRSTDVEYCNYYETLVSILKVVPDENQIRNDILAASELFADGTLDLTQQNHRDICQKVFEYKAFNECLIEWYLEDFLTGRWEDFYYGYYFEIENGEKRRYCQYNLPCDDVENIDHYDITEGIYCLYDANDNLLVTHFKFEIIDMNTIKVYCYSDNNDYVLTRK